MPDNDDIDRVWLNPLVWNFVLDDVPMEQDKSGLPFGLRVIVKEWMPTDAIVFGNEHGFVKLIRIRRAKESEE